MVWLLRNYRDYLHCLRLAVSTAGAATIAYTTSASADLHTFRCISIRSYSRVDSCVLFHGRFLEDTISLELDTAILILRFSLRRDGLEVVPGLKCLRGREATTAPLLTATKHIAYSRCSFARPLLDYVFLQTLPCNVFLV